MAQLILTPEEQEKALWQHLDDESLGRYMKKQLAGVGDLLDELDIIKQCAIIISLALKLDDLKSSETVYTLKEMSLDDIQLGDWEIIVRRISPPETAE